MCSAASECDFGAGNSTPGREGWRVRVTDTTQTKTTCPRKVLEHPSAPPEARDDRRAESLQRRHGCSGRCGGSLERKSEECGYAEKSERDDIVPCELLLQEKDRKADKDGERDNFLNDFELES
jgi:hypothetical protein